MLYFARCLETKHSEETIPAISDMANEINSLFKRKSVFRIHADRAPELAGERVKAYFRERGVWCTETAGYEPNSNPRAECGVGMAKPRARAMPASLGPRRRELLPAAIKNV